MTTINAGFLLSAKEDWQEAVNSITTSGENEVVF